MPHCRRGGGRPELGRRRAELPQLQRVAPASSIEPFVAEHLDYMNAL